MLMGRQWCEPPGVPLPNGAERPEADIEEADQDIVRCQTSGKLKWIVRVVLGILHFICIKSHIP